VSQNCFLAWQDWFVALHDYGAAQSNLEVDTTDYNDPLSLTLNPYKEQVPDWQLAYDRAGVSLAQSHVFDTYNKMVQACHFSTGGKQ
jgi:hypothetical protein